MHGQDSGMRVVGPGKNARGRPGRRPRGMASADAGRWLAGARGARGGVAGLALGHLTTTETGQGHADEATVGGIVERVDSIGNVYFQGVRAAKIVGGIET